MEPGLKPVEISNQADRDSRLVVDSQSSSIVTFGFLLPFILVAVTICGTLILPPRIDSFSQSGTFAGRRGDCSVGWDWDWGRMEMEENDGNLEINRGCLGELKMNEGRGEMDGGSEGKIFSGNRNGQGERRKIFQIEERNMGQTEH
jgi:hypothetical protein